MDKFSVLKRFFGHTSFREGQAELIDAMVGGRDVLGVMPTGGGKSVCYQVPAMLFSGVTLVISPLISLMKDQVASLKRAGIPAAFINSSLTPRQLTLVFERAAQGQYRIIYVAPERLETEGFRRWAKQAEISLLAVDEAHCISQWGQDFRPGYLKIADFIDILPKRPVVAAFTATATDLVRQDIEELLRLCDPLRVVTGFDRPNLFFDVIRPKNKVDALLQLLLSRREQSGIVYCATRSSVEQICHLLCDHGISATRYHAGLEDEERRTNQEDFQFDRKRVMVATNAFGMGIDKSNVGFVIHYQMPKSLESYYQEAGRAGRDGEKADCILLYTSADEKTARFLIENRNSEDLNAEQQEQVRLADYERLRAMICYCRTESCLRGQLLSYFGQAHPQNCGNCGNCHRKVRRVNATKITQLILSCIMRIKEKIGYYVGKTLVAQVLHGSENKRVLALGLEQIPTYGILQEQPLRRIRFLMDLLETEGYLRVEPQHETLRPGQAAPAVLRGDRKVELLVRVRSKSENETALRQQQKRKVPEHGALYEALRAVRLEIAQKERVPAYVVFSNATLADMAKKAPRTLSEFLEVSGVGEIKAARYGAFFLAAIAAYDENR